MKSKVNRDFESIYRDMVQAIKGIVNHIERIEKSYRSAEDRDDYELMAECEALEKECYDEISLIYLVVMNRYLEPVKILRILKIRR